MMRAMDRVARWWCSVVEVARRLARPRRSVVPLDEARLAIDELAHERDVSIARASEAIERERLALQRLEVLEPLEHRVEMAERRALDAERRLEEISERVERAQLGDDSPGPPGGDPDDVSDPAASARQAAELRERLSRTAAKKKGGRDR